MQSLQEGGKPVVAMPYMYCGGAAGNSDATRTEAKLDVLTKLLQDMVERLEKLEKANVEKGIDEKIEAAVERKITHVLEEAKEKGKKGSMIS